jgi:hypothetical protein
VGVSYFFNFLSSVVRNSQLIAIAILFDGNMIDKPVNFRRRPTDIVGNVLLYISTSIGICIAMLGIRTARVAVK